MTADTPRSDFRERVLNWAMKLHVSVTSVTIRPMRSKWASCSTAGNVTFNTDLLALGYDLQDYVIVHELLHIAVPNHGGLWKSLMRSYLGDYESLDSRLRALTRSELRQL